MHAVNQPPLVTFSAQGSHSSSFAEEVACASQLTFIPQKIVWIFDHSSCHTAMPEDALIVSRMNVNPGGKQTSYEGWMVVR